MKVSIIIPVYDAAKYLNECVNSALAQTYSDLEIIAVDDGSKDNSLEILNQYSDKIKIISKKNSGTASALNAGIKTMTAEWFKWLSADDVLKKNAVETLVSEVNKLGNDSKSCILYSNYDIIDESGKTIGEVTEPNYNDLGSFEQNVILLDHFYGNGTTSLIHKSVFAKSGLFNEKIRFKDDYEFWLRCCLLHGYRMHLLDQNIAKYRIHEEQLTKKKMMDALEQISQIKNMILSKLSTEQKEKYLVALKEYQKQKPVKLQIRRSVRDTMFKVFPRGLSEKILRTYLRQKKY
ncbi:MAG: glycosyltransferase [Nitrosopumilaceae archaeon]